MPFHSPSSAREKIIVFGKEGSGKTSAILEIADLSIKTNSDSKFYIIDTDDAYARMLENQPVIRDSGRIEVTQAYDWEDYMSALRLYSRRLNPEDWLVIDFFDMAWDWVQDYFVEQVFHQDIGQYFLKARMELSGKDKTLGALEGWKDWPVIKKLYSGFIKEAIKKTNCNLYCTAHANTVSKEDDKATKTVYGHIGFKPKGNGNDPHEFHTVLFSNYKGQGEWDMTTAKDRERKYMEHELVHNFALDYLVKIAGWKLA